jgi:hypothetical protein
MNTEFARVKFFAHLNTQTKTTVKPEKKCDKVFPLLDPNLTYEQAVQKHLQLFSTDHTFLTHLQVASDESSLSPRERKLHIKSVMDQRPKRTSFVPTQRVIH